MQSYLIEQVVCDGLLSDVLIKDGRFESIEASQTDNSLSEFSYVSPLRMKYPEAEVLDGKGMAIVPAFYNTHTHNAMSLLRGYADDMPLQTWLNDHIWPAEAKMTAEDMRAGVCLSMLEMIHSGTVFFNDMYFNWRQCQDAVEEMGMRAVVSNCLMSFYPEAAFEDAYFMASHSETWAKGVMWSIGSHAIYTCDEKTLRQTAEKARETGRILHIHLAETQTEDSDCRQQHGCSPVEWLDRLGVLGPNVVAAHCVCLSEHDAELLAERGVVIAHNPCSNMKLASGSIPYPLISKYSLKMTLGTDGSSSNNNLDMLEEMKFASLMAKLNYGAEALPASEVYRWATRNGAEAFGLNAGVVAVGKDADALLINLNDPKLVPGHHFESDWVYSADRACIDTVFCQGRVLMRHGKIHGEEEIIVNARRHTHDLLKRLGKDMK